MRLLAIFLVFLVSGCASIPFKTMYNFWNFDPWSSDFREWRAGARLPVVGAAALKPRVKLTIETWHGEETQKASEVFVLLPTNDTNDLTLLTTEARVGYSLIAYRIDPQDHDRLERLRQRVMLAKIEAGPQLQGKLTVNVSACGGKNAMPKGKFLVSTYLLVDRKDGYNPLIVDYDLAEELNNASLKIVDKAC